MSARATLIGSGAIALWSSLAALTVASGKMPPFQLAALTFAIGGVAGLVVVAVRGRLALLRQPWPVLATGTAGLFLYHALYFAALRLAPPAEAGLVNYLWPLLIVLLSGLLPGERLGIRHILGAAMGLAGVVCLAWPALSGGLDARASLGLALAAGAALVWAVYSVASRRFGQVPSDAVAGFCLATSVLALVCHLLFETTVWPSPGTEWAAIAALGLGPVGLAFYLWDHGVKHGDIRLLGVFSYAAPLASTGLLLAAGMAKPHAMLLAACILIAGGAALAASSGNAKRPAKPPA